MRRYCKQLEYQYFLEASGRYGRHAQQVAKLVTRSPNVPIVRPFERVQFDGHRLDVAITVRFVTPEGDYITRPLNRIWLLTVCDVATRAILG
ncbi:MAG: hypothetical protein IMW91_06360 [Firmicutes bacterium]|nr:hypothetical protein [Bacillota bacterium]